MRLAIFIVACLAPSMVQAADCATDLKPTDTFKELSAKLKCLNDRISVLEKGGAASVATRPQPQPIPGTRVQEAGGIKIELESCSKSGSGISCKIFVTSSDNDREAGFSDGSRAVDYNGVVLTWKGYQTAGEQMRRGWINRSFIADTRTAANIYFEAERETLADGLRALQVIYSTERSERTATFKNVPLTQVVGRSGEGDDIDRRRR
jgi:hypothetical protein